MLTRPGSCTLRYPAVMWGILERVLTDKATWRSLEKRRKLVHLLYVHRIRGVRMHIPAETLLGISMPSG